MTGIFSRAWLRDAAERIAATFAQAFLGVFGTQQIVEAVGGHIDLSLLQTAYGAGLAAVLALLKAAVAAKVSDTVSPASLVPAETKPRKKAAKR